MKRIMILLLTGMMLAPVVSAQMSRQTANGQSAFFTPEKGLDYQYRLIEDPEPDPDYGYQREYRIKNLLTGVFLYSWSIPLSLGVQSQQAIGLGMITASASYFIPLLLTQRQEVTYSQYLLGTKGQFLGYGDGLLFGAAAGVPNRLLPLYGTLFSVGENIWGYAYGKKLHLTPGDAHYMIYNKLNTSVKGTLLALAIDGGNEPQYVYAGALIGSLVGTGVAAAHSDVIDFTRGDVNVMSTGSILWTALPLSFFFHYETPSVNLLGGALLAGNLVGSVYGRHLVKKYGPFERGESRVTNASALAGAVLGLGIAFSAGLAENPTPEGVAISVGIGAIAGQIVGASVVRNRRKAKAERL